MTINLNGFGGTIIVACMLGTLTACSSFYQSNSQRPSKKHATPTEAGFSLGFSLTNSTGTALRSVYLSPHASSGWEENVLGEAELKDGDTVNIRFNPNEKTMMWDMKVEGIDGRYAEWKELKLGDISEMTLVLKLMPQPMVIAEVE